MARNRVRSPEEQDALLEQTLRSRVFRAGAALAAIGGLSVLVGVGDYIGEKGEYTEEMLIGGYSAVTIGAFVAVASGLRTVYRFDRANSQEQTFQP